MAQEKEFKVGDKVAMKNRENKYTRGKVIEITEGCNWLVKVFFEDGFYGSPCEATLCPQDLYKRNW